MRGLISLPIKLFQFLRFLYLLNFIQSIIISYLNQKLFIIITLIIILRNTLQMRMELQVSSLRYQRIFQEWQDIFSQTSMELLQVIVILVISFKLFAKEVLTGKIRLDFLQSKTPALIYNYFGLILSSTTFHDDFLWNLHSKQIDLLEIPTDQHDFTNADTLLLNVSNYNQNSPLYDILMVRKDKAFFFLQNGLISILVNINPLQV